MKRDCLNKLLIIIGLLVLWGCKKDIPPTALQSMKVSAAKPHIKRILLHKVYPAYLSAQNTVELVARVNGYLESAPFSGGSVVKKGQLLFVIEPSLYQDAVDQAEAELESAQAQLDYAENNYVRMNEASRSDAISEIDLIQAATQLLSAKSNVSSTKAQLSSAKTNLSYCYIHAPYTGRITLSTLSNYNYLAGGVSPVTLATIYQEDLMYAYFNIEDNQYLKMLAEKKSKRDKTRDSVEVSLQPPSNKRYKARLEYVSPNIDLSTGTLRLRAEVINKENDLKDGMYANVSLPYGEKDSAILIKDAAIGYDQLGSYIYIVNDSSEISYRHIEIGELVDDTLRDVISGLSGNDIYITRALLKVREGMKVEPIIEK